MLILIHYAINLCINLISLCFFFLFFVGRAHSFELIPMYIALTVTFQWYFDLFAVLVRRALFWAFNACLLIELWMINYYVWSLIDKHLSFGTESISFVYGGTSNANRDKYKWKKKLEAETISHPHNSGKPQS